MIWEGKFIRDGKQNSLEHVNAVYISDYVITRDELPESLYRIVTNNGGSESYIFTANGSFTFEFIDSQGNLGTVVATVNNIDMTAPTLMVKPRKPVLSPPNHKLVNVLFDWNVHDEGSGVATVRLVSVTSNEPDNGIGDGDTVSDIQGAEIGTADQSIQLRAERAGGGKGREYTIVYEAFDLAGNRTEASTTVTVR